MAITNATRLSDFAAGIGTEGAILQIDNANQRVGIGTQLPSQMLEVAGIVTATAFHGDGSNLEGITSAGLGTAIDDTDGSAGAVIYYTDDLLTVSETTTVNPPASASAAYTQYRDVKLNDSVDLIIESGDDFIPDVLGFGDDTSDPNASGNGVFDEVYTSIIKNKDGLGAPAFANGLTSVGVITATGGFSGNVTGDVTGNVNNSTNLSLKTNNAERVRIDSTGKVGISTGNIDPSGNQLLIRGESTIGTNKGHIMLTGDSSVVGEGPQIVFSESGPGANWAGAYIGHTRQGGGSVGDLRFGTRAAVGDADTAPTERLRISNTGAFGIGGANYGTSGQVLTSQGNSAAPQWADAGGGAWEVVSTTLLSGSNSTLDFNNWSNAYQKYQLVFNNVYQSNNNFQIWLRVYMDATSGNTGTLASASAYVSNNVQAETTASGIGGSWSGWNTYHKLASGNSSSFWHGTYDFYMTSSTSQTSGNNETSWQGSNLRERVLGVFDGCCYTTNKSEYVTGVRIYFFDNSGNAVSPNDGRFTLYRMKYS